MTVSDTISQDEARAKFAASLSQMYREEIPQYGTLLDLVSGINKRVSKDSPDPQDGMSRVEVERHGAIRLGTAQELAMTRRLFSIFGMQPVGYYNLTVAGLPVHATGFRPVTESSLHYNPFRVFTSLLRLDLIKDEALRARAQDILHQRAIFTRRCVELIVQLENNPSLPLKAANGLINEALETFRWHETSTVDIETYKEFEAKHPLIADIVCFRGPHINHLTPLVLDIDTAQAAMQSRGLQAKTSIEGPPSRQNEILLRQTSFLALEESIAFSGGAQTGGRHRARFGEIEQRGMALTPKGREMYDQCLDPFNRAAVQLHPNSSREWKAALLRTCFEEIPDDINELRRAKLAYFRYDVVSGSKRPAVVGGIDSLVDAGCVSFTPITYEDFLPASAAGIFQSNLCVDGVQHQSGFPNKESFERALGCSVLDEFGIYSNIEQLSIAVCLDFFKDGL